MPTKTKMKIDDDISLRTQLDLEYEKSSQVKLCQYALSLAKHILELVQYPDAHHPLINNGYLMNEMWQRGEVRMHDVRQAGFQIHNLAKQCDDVRYQTALRVVGQAVATGHMKEHAMVASDYAIKVMNLLYPHDHEAVVNERLWQIEKLKSIKEK